MGAADHLAIEAAHSEAELRAFNDAASRLRPYFAQTFEEFEHERGWAAADQQVHLLARVNGRVAGVGWASRNSMHKEQARMSAFILADPDFDSVGVAAALFEGLSRFAAGLGFSGLSVERGLDDVPDATFWAERGYQEVERYIDVGLDLETFTVPPFELPRSVRIAPMNEHLNLIEQVYDVIGSSLVDIPTGEEIVMPPYELWLQQELASPTSPPDLWHVALTKSDVGDDLAVGIGMLERQLARPEVVWHGFTCVRSNWRRTGIARALKYTTIRHAQQLGFRTLQTENEERNAPMRTLNIELGYQPLPVRVLLHGPLA